ncbi:AraC-like DNA-binding protein [Acinetobacter calcoaceticus]|uniref:AraC-like DNA-binding protein n=1 Tax=Acinetobacter calcoaceticus TaxID=471 RepID=A0A4R1XK04_ACICA|nr:AraC-like DNA-binding protein [Acinetobacter calcoaceticus]
MKRSILSLIYLINGMRKAGIDVDARLAAIGIKADALDPSAIFHHSIEWSIQNIIGRGIAPEIGLEVGRHYALAGYGPLLMLLLSCERIEDALLYGVKFQKLTHLYGTLALSTNQERIVLSYQPIDFDGEIGKFRAQCEISGTYRFILNLYKMMGLNVPQLRVALPFPKPTDPQLLAQYQDVYAENVEFDQATARFELDRQMLSIKIPSADSITCRLYEEKCQAEIQRLENPVFGNGLIERVTDFLDLQLGAMPTMTETAQALNLAERTLRHQLQQQNTSYKAIREQLIQRKALALIKNKAYPIAEIAERLGYSETAAFNHAFKRWFGQSPSHYGK